MNAPDSIDSTAALLAEHNYVADRQLATAVFLALKLKRPLFLEGEPGTGKTEIAKVLSAGLLLFRQRHTHPVECKEKIVSHNQKKAGKEPHISLDIS